MRGSERETGSRERGSVCAYVDEPDRAERAGRRGGRGREWEGGQEAMREEDREEARG